MPAPLVQHAGGELHHRHPWSSDQEIAVAIHGNCTVMAKDMILHTLFSHLHPDLVLVKCFLLGRQVFDKNLVFHPTRSDHLARSNEPC